MEVIISGYGKMGKMVESVLAQRGITLAMATEDVLSVPHDIASRCVCIDFTTPDAICNNYPFLAKHFKAVVIGTTGWNHIKDEVIECFKREGTPMIYASNFSVGVNLLFAAVDFLTQKMALTGGYSPYMIEMHHCHKLDAPSGTAKSLAEIVDRNMGGKVDIQAVRCGEIPGIHTVGFEGTADRITISHEAFSRMGFAQGAVEAAVIADRTEGVHEFKDLIFNSQK